VIGGTIRVWLHVIVGWRNIIVSSVHVVHRVSSLVRRILRHHRLHRLPRRRLPGRHRHRHHVRRRHRHRLKAEAARGHHRVGRRCDRRHHLLCRRCAYCRLRRLCRRRTLRGCLSFRRRWDLFRRRWAAAGSEERLLGSGLRLPPHHRHCPDHGEAVGSRMPLAVHTVKEEMLTVKYKWKQNTRLDE